MSEKKKVAILLPWLKMGVPKLTFPKLTCHSVP